MNISGNEANGFQCNFKSLIVFRNSIFQFVETKQANIIFSIFTLTKVLFILIVMPSSFKITRVSLEHSEKKSCLVINIDMPTAPLVGIILAQVSFSSQKQK